MSLRDDKQQHIQMQLDFSTPLTGEAREAGRQETESSSTTSESESPARTDRLMEEVCERENLKEALRRVKANKGSAGIDGITVAGLPDFLKQHWPVIRHSHRAGPIHPAGGDAGSAAAVGPHVFRSQLWFSTEAVGSSGSG